MHPRHLQTFNAISGQISQMRTLVSLVAKLHICRVLERDRNIPFQIHQTYFDHLFSIILDPSKSIRSEDTNYVADIGFCVNQVLTIVSPRLICSQLGETQMKKFTGAVSSRMVTDIQNHVRMRFQQSVTVWLKNQFRMLMTREEYETQRKSMKTYFEDFKNYPENFEFNEAYKRYIAQSAELGSESDDTDGPAVRKIDVNPFLISMWEMRKECELAGISSGRSMKEITVIPQASFKVGFIHVDTSSLSFLRAFLEGETTTKGYAYSSRENQEATWQYFFKMDELRNIKNQQRHPFTWSISTDGVTASVRFSSFLKKSKTTKRKASSVLPTSIRNGFHSESKILEEYEGHDSDVRFYSVDPGVRSIVTIYGVREDKCVYELKQGTYRHSIGLNDVKGRKGFVKKQIDKLGMKAFRKQQRQQQKVCHSKSQPKKNILRRKPFQFQKSVISERMNAFMNQVGKAWTYLWPIASENQLQKGDRRRRFRRANKRRKFMDKTVQQIKSVLAPNAVILFGRGGESGGFKCRGGGLKGPVLGLKRRLAQEFPMICCSEFRTSKLCSECARILEHPKRYNPKTGYRDSVNGVSFCSNTDHKYRTLNRDIDASRKIGLRFLMQLFHQDIGPWAYNTTSPEHGSWTKMREFSDFYHSQAHPTVEGFDLLTRSLERTHKVTFQDGGPPKKGRHSEN